ncbi:TetR/AcrR family transcriptional regulator C-terminal domain-containing protein [Cryptosporangium sp. NPDC051539]|uniref:TetR/AcrR family transcriptional regulator C-terminal domain-containing protein n=1 Tax=Cryptosporangium sp. NPDC051539 TaxID=3363962 RepID=UPI0037A7040B
MSETPSARIIGELRRRIESGDLRPGDRLPSTRQITSQWGVAMATATKVLTALRHAGLVDAVPGVGTVVRPGPGPGPGPGSGSGSGSGSGKELPPPGPASGFTPPRDHPTHGHPTHGHPDPDPLHPAHGLEPVLGLPDPPRRRRRPTDEPLTRERVIAAALAIADADGMAELSMRRVAADLGVATMALYRYVPSKEDLVIHMLDAVFGEVSMIPDPEPAGWRAKLESVARKQWDVYRQHRWMAGALSFSRPQLVPRGMVHTEYAMAAMNDTGLAPAQLLHVAVCLFNHVRSVALVHDEELRNQQDTGMDAGEWMDGQDDYFVQVLATGQFPMMAAVSSIPDDAFSIESMFEFGLARYLDGVEVLISG